MNSNNKVHIVEKIRKTFSSLKKSKNRSEHSHKKLNNIFKDKSKSNAENEEKMQTDKRKGLKIAIKYKLLAAFFIPIIFIVILGTVSYRKASEAIISNYETTTFYSIENISDYFSLMFGSVEKRTQTIRNNEDIVGYYSGQFASSRSYEANLLKDFKDNILLDCLSDDYINSVNIIGGYGYSISTLGNFPTENALTEFAATSEGTAIQQAMGKCIWLGSHSYIDEAFKLTEDDYSLCVGRQFANASNKEIGAIVIDIKKDAILEPIINMELPKGSYCALVTSDGKEVTTDDMKGKMTFTGKDFFTESADVSGRKYVKVDGEKYLYMYANIGETGNKLACMVPESAIVKKADAIKIFTYGIVTVSILIAIIIAFVIAEGISKAIRKINLITKKAAEGDLTVLAETARRDEFKDLVNHISNMLTEMKQLITQVTVVTDTVTDSADDVSDNSNKLVSSARNISEIVNNMETGINQQADDAENCLKKMDELSGKIMNVVNSAQSINESSNNTRLILKDGMGTINDLNDRMKDTSEITKQIIVDIEELRKESMLISTITGTINEIAEQTNLLSLNASIEAARAGDAGRGFSVVADEIRKLADESVAASNKIRQIIQNIDKSTKGTVDTAKRAEDIVVLQEEALGNTVSIFNAIHSHMQKLSENIDQITSEAKEMIVTKDNTLSAIENISAVLEETAAASSEVLTAVEGQVDSAEYLNTASRTLRDDSKKLQQAITIFKID